MIELNAATRAYYGKIDVEVQELRVANAVLVNVLAAVGHTRGLHVEVRQRIARVLENHGARWGGPMSLEA